MKTIPLYPELPLADVERATPLDRDPHCQRCPLHKRAANVCLSAEGEPGGLLVVGRSPTKAEDDSKRAMSSETGKLVRVLVNRYWKGPVAFDYAVKCFSGSEMLLPERHIDPCRGFLTAVIKEVQPSRVVVMGDDAVMSVLGRKLPLVKARRGYGWLASLTPKPIPVFYTLDPSGGLRNKFIRGWFEGDFRWALETEVPFQPAWKGIAKVITCEADALQAEKELTAAPWFSYDIESAGVPWSVFQVLCGACAVPGSDDVWVWDNVEFNTSEIRAVQARLLSNPKARKVGSNFTWDINGTLFDLGVQLEGVLSDTRLKRKLMDGEASGKLEHMAELVGMGGHKNEAKAALEKAKQQVIRIAQTNGSPQEDLFAVHHGDLRDDVVATIRPGVETKAFSYGLIPRTVRLRYNALDALATARIETLLAHRMEEEPDLTRLWDGLIIPAADAFRQVEAWGVSVSLERVTLFQQMLQQQKAEVLQRIHVYGKINPDSTNEVLDLLFKTLKLPPAHLTPSGKQPSTDDEALEALKGKHPVVAELQAYRSVAKLDSVYATGMLQHIKPDGRIHPSFLLDGTASGRPSCSNPNLQNIPRDADSPEGKMARDCFIASPGYRLLQFDYNQLELRVAALLSGDPEMRKVFEDGVDFHLQTAKFIAPIVWKMKPENVTKKERSAAKSFNFGILYGMGDRGIAARAGCSVETAMKIREAVLGRFVKLDEWIKARFRYAQKHGECWTWWDGHPARRRPLPALGDRDAKGYGSAKNSSWNTPIQGTGSDFLVASLVEVVRWIREDAVPARLMLPVHDSLLLEVRDDVVDEASYQVHRIMTSWPSNGVPLAVDVEEGILWGSLTKRAA